MWARLVNLTYLQNDEENVPGVYGANYIAI